MLIRLKDYQATLLDRFYGRPLGRFLRRYFE